MWGDEDWQKHQQEQQARAAALHADQERRGEALEALLRGADVERDAAQVIAMARLIDPQAFQTRDTMLEGVRRMRSGRSGNDPEYQNAIATHTRVARLSIEFAVAKAQQAIALVRSWDAQP